MGEKEPIKVGNQGQLVITSGPSTLGFYGAAPQPQPTVTGSRGGNEALESLLSALSRLGLITDKTTP